MQIPGPASCIQRRHSTSCELSTLAKTQRSVACTTSTRQVTARVRQASGGRRPFGEQVFEDTLQCSASLTDKTADFLTCLGKMTISCRLLFLFSKRCAYVKVHQTRSSHGWIARTPTYGLTVDAFSACRPKPCISVGGPKALRDTKLVNLNLTNRCGIRKRPRPVPTREIVRLSCWSPALHSRHFRVWYNYC